MSSRWSIGVALRSVLGGAALVLFACGRSKPEIAQQAQRLTAPQAPGQALLDSVPELVSGRRAPLQCSPGDWMRHQRCYAFLPREQTPSPGTVTPIAGASTFYDTTADRSSCEPSVDGPVFPLLVQQANERSLWLNVVGIQGQNYFVKGTLQGAQLAPSGLKADCTSVLNSARSADELAFRGTEWLQGVFKLTSERWIALVHSEYYGGDYPSGWYFRIPASARCPSGQPVACWYGATTAFVKDAAASAFLPLSPPRGHVVARPFTNHQSSANDATVLYTHGTNTVFRNGVYYTVLIDKGPAFAATPAELRAPDGSDANVQYQSICPARTTNLERPDSWRAWDGRGYTVNMSAGRRCTGVPNAVFPFYLGYSTFFDAFILVGSAELPTGPTGAPVPQVAYNLSKDMVHWSAPAPLAGVPLFGTSRHNYPSLMDLTALTSANADANAQSGGEVGQTPWLLWRKDLVDPNPQRDPAVDPFHDTATLERMQVRFER